MLRPTTGRASLKRLLSFLERVEPGGEYPFERAVGDVLGRHRGRGVAVLVSDFLTFGDLPAAFNRLHAAGLEPWAVQVLAPEELEPDLSGDVRLVDSETATVLDVTRAGDLLDLYREHLDALHGELYALCRQRGGRFLSVSSDEPLDAVLFDTLRRRGWLR